MYSRWTKLIALLLLMAVGTVNMVTGLAALSRTPVQETSIEEAIDALPDGFPSLAAYLALTRFHFEGPENGRSAAAFKYLTFFLFTTRGVSVHCDEVGADIRGALVHFAHANAIMYRHASDILKAEGLNSERLWKLLGSDLERFADITLQRVQATRGVDRADACRWISENGAAYSASQSYSRLFPAEHAKFTGQAG